MLLSLPGAAAEGSGLVFLDGRSLINDPLYLMVIDQVHPNEAGSLKMAEGISAVLTSIFKPEYKRMN